MNHGKGMRMKGFVLSLVVGLVAATTAFAGPQDAKAKPKTEIKPVAMVCAVETDHKIDIKKATAAKMFADYKGNRYFFCCSGCPEEFKKNPEKYTKSAHIKTPATAPAKGKKA